MKKDEPFPAELQAWRSMLSRCYNKNYTNYSCWGGRGIAVCDRWRFGEDSLDGFGCFLSDMGPRSTSGGYSLDRIDNDGAYAPTNCRWADRLTQAQNKQNNRVITLRGERVTLLEALRRARMSPPAFYRRIRKGMSETEALERPRRKYPEHISRR
jgi:hypothetical protein